MDRPCFLTISFILIISFLFVKIYQHNRVVKLIYAKQSIDRKKEKLCKQRDELLVKIFKLKNPKLVRKKAVEQLGMRDLKLSQIVTVTFGSNTLC